MKTGNFSQSIQMIISKWKFVGLAIMLTASLTFLVSALIPPTYGSEAEIIILQKNLDADAYKAAKSSEYAAAIIKRVVRSTNFMEGVLNSRFGIKDTFGSDPKKRITNWDNTVVAGAVADTGILKIKILTKDKGENSKIMNAVIEKLINDGTRYHGNPNIELKKIGGPIFYEKPEYPNVLGNTVIAGLIGLFLGLGLILVFGENVDSWIYRNPRARNAGKELEIEQELTKLAPILTKTEFEKETEDSEEYGLDNQRFKTIFSDMKLKKDAPYAFKDYEL